jgi:hypothetical protein
MLKGASQHQLNLSVAGATLIAFQPPGKGPRFSMTLGVFHREGSWEDLPFKELESAIKEMESLEVRVVEKLEGGALKRAAASGD